MEALITFAKTQVPLGVVIIVGIIVLNYRLKDLRNRLAHMEDKFDRQLKWCIDHFQPKK